MHRACFPKLPILTLLGAATLLTTGCPPESSPTQAAIQPTVRLSGNAATDALNDLSLMLQHAFYLSVTLTGVAEAGDRHIDTPDGRLSIVWSQEGNLASGSGRFVVELNSFAIPLTSPFASGYNGYVVSGTLLVNSMLSENRFAIIRAELAHAEPDLFPVHTIKSEIHRGPQGLVPSRIYVSVNGTTFDAERVYPEQ